MDVHAWRALLAVLERVGARAEALQRDAALEDIQVGPQERARRAQVSPVAVLHESVDLRAVVDGAHIRGPVDVALPIRGQARDQPRLENVNAGEMRADQRGLR